MIKAQNLNATLPTIIIICYIYVTAGAEPLGRGGYTKTLRDVQKRCYLQERDAARVQV